MSTGGVGMDAEDNVSWEKFRSEGRNNAGAETIGFNLYVAPPQQESESPIYRREWIGAECVGTGAE
jgi:hypothetical protein